MLREETDNDLQLDPGPLRIPPHPRAAPAELIRLRSRGVEASDWSPDPNTGRSLVTWWSRDPDTCLSLADCDTQMMTPDCLTWADREEPGPGPSNLQSHSEQFWLWCRVSCAVVNGYSPDFLEAIEDRRQHSSWDENQQEVHSVLPSLSGYGLILHI